VVYPVNPWHLPQIARIYAIQNGDIYPKFIRVGSALVVGVNATSLAKPMLGRLGAELIQRQVFSALNHGYT
jgi:4-hydroxy-3-methylbut-2-en-1-yl diphosphate synthase IspG/GcpE